MTEKKKGPASKGQPKAKISDRVATVAAKVLPEGKATPKQAQTLAGEVERQREAQKVSPAKPSKKKK